MQYVVYCELLHTTLTKESSLELIVTDDAPLSGPKIYLWYEEIHVVTIKFNLNTKNQPIISTKIPATT